MILKAVLFDFNGVIINDEPIHEQLIEQLLIEENLRPKPGEFREICLGRSDRVCLAELFKSRGRFLNDALLDQLVSRKSDAYQKILADCPELPIYPDLAECVALMQTAELKLAIVSGALRHEILTVLERIHLKAAFSVIVSGEDISTSKPEPDGYLLAIARLNATFADLDLQPSQCLAIEDTFAGIEAAKRAGIPVVGVANTYPFHMLQRRANWTVDALVDLEFDRIRGVERSWVPEIQAS